MRCSEAFTGGQGHRASAALVPGTSLTNIRLGAQEFERALGVVDVFIGRIRRFLVPVFCYSRSF